jgi:uncharacterized protein YndB with AHSA1/START domain
VTAHTPVGKTKTQGWEIGVRRTFPITTEQAWELLMTTPGLDVWLGEGAELTLKKHAKYETEDGTTGEVRSFREGDLIRVTWQPPQWEFASTLQIRVVPASKGATIVIHHEKLDIDNGDQREQMRDRWSGVLDKFETLIKET